MSCYLTCMIGASLLGGTISSMLYSKNPQSKVLVNMLNKEQKVIYNRIVKERSSHYFEGTLLGLFFALLYFLNSGKFEKKTNICAFVLIAMSTSYYYYTLKPKSDYMLKHLINPKQVGAWLSHYNNMKKRYHIGFLITGMSYLTISYGLYSFQ